MNHSRKTRKATAALVFFYLLILLSGCRNVSNERRAIVFCAASLTEAVNQCWLNQNEKLAIQSGGSNLLAAQYAAGARADVLLLADFEILRNAVPNSSVNSAVIATNDLVLITGDRSINSPSGLADKLLAVADPQTAPLGKYALEALESKPIASRRITLKDATSVLAAVAHGHADIGIVYSTDAKSNTKVKVIHTFASESHTPIRYRALLINPQNPTALKLFSKLQSEAGQRTLREAGFGLISKKSRK